MLTNVEVCDMNGICCGFLEVDVSDSPAGQKVRIEGRDWDLTEMKLTLRVEPGKFACFTVKAVLLPVHILPLVVQCSAFKPRGTVEFVLNNSDPELLHQNVTKH